MELLLLMSVSGSLMMAFYLLFKRFAGDMADAKWRYRILKMALFFYLAPVQAVKRECERVYYKYFVERDLADVWLNEDIVQTKKGMLPRYSMNYTWKYIFLIAAVIILGILICRMMGYVKNYRMVLKHPAGRQDDRIETGVRRQMDRLGIKRKIACRVYRGSQDSFTIGVFRPVIALDDSGCDEEERELIIRHELMHVKSWDGLVKLLGMIATGIHFFNPLVYYLFCELSAAGEWACDEKVVSQMDEEEKRRYCNLLVKMAQRKKEDSYILNFGGNKEHNVKGRIVMMSSGKNRKKGWQVFSGVALSIMVILVSSMTTLAYEPPTSLGLDDSNREMEHGHGKVDRVFVANGYEEENPFAMDVFELSFEDSDAYFVDEQGNRYDVSEHVARASCNHTYVDGKYNDHVRNGAGCTVYVYNSQRCTECGHVELQDIDNEIKFAKCPH